MCRLFCLLCGFDCHFGALFGGFHRALSCPRRLLSCGLGRLPDSLAGLLHRLDGFPACLFRLFLCLRGPTGRSNGSLLLLYFGSFTHGALVFRGGLCLLVCFDLLTMMAIGILAVLNRSLGTGCRMLCGASCHFLHSVISVFFGSDLPVISQIIHLLLCPDQAGFHPLTQLFGFVKGANALDLFLCFDFAHDALPPAKEPSPGRVVMS